MRSWGMDYREPGENQTRNRLRQHVGAGTYRAAMNYVSYGPTLQALSGFTRLMTEGEGEPAGYGYSYADMSGGYTRRVGGADRAMASASAPDAASSSISRSSRR